jgi:hypothetical protein
VGAKVVMGMGMFDLFESLNCGVFHIIFPLCNILILFSNFIFAAANVFYVWL